MPLRVDEAASKGISEDHQIQSGLGEPGRIGIFGDVLGVILSHVAFGLPFAIFLLRNFFTQFPTELLEAARVDGASDWMVFLSIVMPLGLPAIASLAIFQFLWTWDDMLVAFIFAFQRYFVQALLAGSQR